MIFSDSIQELLTIMVHKAAEDILHNRPCTISHIQHDDICTDIIIMNGTKYNVQPSIKNLDEVLPSSKFFHCGPDFFVNIDSVIDFRETDKPMLFLSCGSCIFVSPNEVPRLKTILERVESNFASNGIS